MRSSGGLKEKNAEKTRKKEREHVLHAHEISKERTEGRSFSRGTLSETASNDGAFLRPK